MNEIINKLNNNVHDLNNNYKQLCSTLLKNNNYESINVISHITDINEIFDILNELIQKLNDNIELNNDINISSYALERVENYKTVLAVLKPFLPFILNNLAYNM